MLSALKSLGVTVIVVLLLAGIAALVYARWSSPMTDGDASLAQDQYVQALASYATAESRFDRFPALKHLFAGDYDHLIGNELLALYRMERYDETIDRADRAPETASPHFWSGCAFFKKAIVEEKPEARLGWLGRAEEEFHKAVEAAPNDWDTKFDFELTTRLAAELRKQPKTPPRQLMQLLRPPTAPKSQRRVG
jgi:tetratricopeptide (TPR) repeat protein